LSSKFQATTPTLSFQYPVQAEVERASKFHSSQVDGRTYKAYRRVVLITMEEFKRFAKRVGELYSS